MSVLHRLKAIPTTYKGIAMRSKLEATIAQQMDRAGIVWEYEREGFDLNGTWYLPDFWCPEIRTFVEVKGVMDPESLRKIDLLARLANGLPENSQSRGMKAVGGYNSALGYDQGHPTIDQRTSIHVVVLPRPTILTGHYAPSGVAEGWGQEAWCYASNPTLSLPSFRPPYGATTVSKGGGPAHSYGFERYTESHRRATAIDADGQTLDYAFLAECHACERRFWQNYFGWWGCYACGAGHYYWGKNDTPVRQCLVLP